LALRSEEVIDIFVARLAANEILLTCRSGVLDALTVEIMARSSSGRGRPVQRHRIRRAERC
jgi:hypothetical protein